MSEEISLSLEETNKLRIKAGLSPIPTTSSQSNEKVREVISLSIEETNKLRQKIGLPLLPTTTTTNISSDSTEYKNYEDYERERLQNLKNNQLIERINNAKFNSNKRKFLTNETIIDNAEDLDTDDWLNNLGESTESSKPHKKQKTTIVKSNQNDTGPTTTIIGHTTKELQSLGNNEILTLKDTDLINDDDEDGTGSILMNQDLSNKAKLKRNLAERKEAENIKFNGRHYRRNNKEEEEEEEEEFNDIDGLLTNDKVIMSGSTIDLSSNTAKPPPPPKDKKKNMMAITNLFEDLDNVTLSNNNNIKSNVPIKMKKIKKKKDNNKKKSNKLKLLDDSIKPVELSVESNIGDDDDIDDIENQLSNSISNLRTKKLQTRLEFTPEQLAEEISANKRWEFERKLEQENLKNNNNNNNVYNDTIGFLNNLETNILSESGEVEVTANINEESADDDDKDDVKQQEVESKQTNPGVYSIVEEKQKEDEAPKFSGGLAETLKFLKSRNILDPESITTTNEELRQQELAREEAIKKSELLKMKISIEERILKEELSKDKSYIRMPKIERSGYFEKLLDTRLKQKGIIIDNNTGTTTKKTNSGMVQNNLKIYNPKVELTYKDELGNVLNTKQAYKQLSHKYHGTGLDKNKKKQEQLKKKQQQQRGSKSTNISTTSTTVTERVIN
ncbi:U4/U6-U5 snRNP complex subunit [Candida albicans SC5314]|uniref:U4/U6-U5 snRNP complex subunit n=1 Tax=Candida albicans (strain SC5314 / ATCC MYA-2876) TaxID=237561 RepID=A0A1D8PNL9_CANAL|nr:U4/U6-U5 snRNP complex subunit [Candida albicans SC5314]AOW29721.1 U4/U6-U5 snRNP complex subunit [Candida albicans SC5314]|eukprot:XP_720632.2 U4/U6-U5 snRNP complex subunit [Candida albicans SC5314]